MQVGFRQTNQNNMAFGQNQKTVSRELSKAVKQYPGNYEQAVFEAKKALFKKDGDNLGDNYFTLANLAKIALRKMQSKKSETKKQGKIIIDIAKAEEKAIRKERGTKDINELVSQ